MRPGDHPDFFRLSPPPGRSRESTIRLDAHGRFFHDGEPVVHPGMARAFASWIARHPDDGRYILTNGWDWSYFTVEDVPFFVEAVRDDAGRPVLVLSDGTEEALDPVSLHTAGDGALSLGVKQGAFAARFRRTAQLELARWLEEDPDGTPVLAILGARYRLGTSA
ncbi:MAG TPA: hypothetical protein VMI54_04520 [Polyangiaceae bacterium]|nr:hypothetical protein [Polyangiaceae bacterium]